MGPLAGQVILNTRPAHQQARLSRLLLDDGAEVLSFPVIEIAIVSPEAIDIDLAQWDWLLFVSRNAVDGAFAALGDRRLPRRLRYGVIGAATRDALLARPGVDPTAVLASEPYNSEALLAAPPLRDVDGRRILILRGQPGRSLLGDELARRGARVEYREVYRRELPARDPAVFDRLAAAAFPTLVVLTSNEGMHNLLALVSARAAERLRRVPWLLISDRMRESARNLGHNAPVLIAPRASDEGIHQAIRAWQKRRLADSSEP